MYLPSFLHRVQLRTGKKNVNLRVVVPGHERLPARVIDIGQVRYPSFGTG